MSALFGLLLALALGFAAVALRPAKTLSLEARVSPSLITESSVQSKRVGLSLNWRKYLVSNATLNKALFELPEILDLLAVALAAGDNLFTAISRVTPRASGQVAKQLELALQALQLGSSLEIEMARIAERLPQKQVIEFCAKVNLSLKRGTPLAGLLREQAESARSEIHNILLKQAGKNETKMLIPLVFLILPVTVLFAIYPSLQLLNLGAL